MPIHYVAVLGEPSKAPLSFYKGLNQGEVIETDKIAEAKQFKTAKEIKDFFRWLESRDIVVKPYQLEKLDWPRNHKDGKIHFMNKELEGLYYCGES